MNKKALQKFLGRIVPLAGIAILVFLFGLSAIGKILEPDTSIVFLSALTGFSGTWSRIFLVLLIGIEAAIALSLILYYNHRWPYYLAGGMLAIFVAAVGYGMWIDVKALCGCFGSIIESTTVNSNALIRNAILAGLAFLIPGLKN